MEVDNWSKLCLILISIVKISDIARIVLFHSFTLVNIIFNVILVIRFLIIFFVLIIILLARVLLIILLLVIYFWIALDKVVKCLEDDWLVCRSFGSSSLCDLDKMAI